MEASRREGYRCAVRHPFRRKNLRFRLVPFYALVALLIWVARPTAASIAFGMPLILAGAGLRIWGAGHLVKTDQLVVSGPYSHLRHPLYAGTLLLALGFGLASGWAGAGLVAIVFLPAFFGYYFPYKERVESDRLATRFGDDYAVYRAEVSALIPSWRGFSLPPGWSHDVGGGWRWERLHDNDELGTVVGVVAGVLLLLFCAGLFFP